MHAFDVGAMCHLAANRERDTRLGHRALSATDGRSGILPRLRAETRREHEAIDTVVELNAIARVPGRYQYLLERFYGFYQPVEGALSAFGGWANYGIDLAARQKSHLLEADLRSLGGAAASVLPRCDHLPELRTLADGFGCLYVMEGSTLGGQLIGRHTREHLGMTPECGGRFFHGYGERTGEQWQDFRTAITRCVVSPTDQDAAVVAAKETFVRLHHWLAAPVPSP